MPHVQPEVCGILLCDLRAVPGIHKLQADAPDSIHPKHLRSPWRAWCPQYPKEAGVPLPPCHRAGLSTESRGLPAGRTACPVPAGSPGGRSPCPGLFLDTAGTRGQDGRVQPRGGGLGHVYQHGRSPAWAGRRLPVAGRATFTSRDSGGQRRHGPGAPSPASRKCLPAGVSATGARQPGGAGGGARQRQTGLAPRGRAAGSEDSPAGTAVAWRGRGGSDRRCEQSCRRRQQQTFSRVCKLLI